MKPNHLVLCLLLLAAPAALAQAPMPPPPRPGSAADLRQQPTPPQTVAPAAGPTAAAPPPSGSAGFGLQDIDPYARCVARAQATPIAGYNEAQAWRAQGGGEAARHCGALALLYGGDPALAAQEFEQLAGDMKLRPAAVRAQILSQAARAWFAAEENARAQQAASAALSLDVADPDLWIDRAEILAASNQLWEAVDDLNEAIDREPRRADALVIRAAAYRRLDARDLARDDIERALAIDPRIPEAWLERGILNRMAGDLGAARRDWLQVLDLDADGPAAEIARANIEALETSQPPRPPPARPPRR
jgi:tetratricopeptide (TPR) repeat protein